MNYTELGEKFEKAHQSTEGNIKGIWGNKVKPVIAETETAIRTNINAFNQGRRNVETTEQKKA